MEQILNHLQLMSLGRVFYCIWVCLSVVLGPCRGHCSRVPYSETEPLVFPKEIRQKSSEIPIDTQKYIPINMKPSKDSSLIAGQIADQSFNTWLNSPQAQSYSFVQTAKEIEDGLKTEIVLSKNQSSQNPHRVSLQYQPFQSIANIRYQGFLSAEVNRYLSEDTTEFKLSDQILQNKELIVQYQTGAHIGSTSSIGLGWRW